VAKLFPAYEVSQDSGSAHRSMRSCRRCLAQPGTNIWQPLESQAQVGGCGKWGCDLMDQSHPSPDTLLPRLPGVFFYFHEFALKFSLGRGGCWSLSYGTHRGVGRDCSMPGWVPTVPLGSSSAVSISVASHFPKTPKKQVFSFFCFIFQQLRPVSSFLSLGSFLAVPPCQKPGDAMSLLGRCCGRMELNFSFFPSAFPNFPVYFCRKIPFGATSLGERISLRLSNEQPVTPPPR